MDQHAVFLLLGLANGAVFAALALALVVTYRSSGVVNFATGAIGLASAYTYASLRRGSFLLLVPGLPHAIDLGGPVSFVPAALISMVVAAAIGLALYATTFRPLRRSSAVAKAVASLGAMVIITGVILQREGTRPVNVAAIFPRNVWEIGSVHVTADRVCFAATVIVMTVVLMAAYRFTRFGLHTRAVSDTEKGAYLSRISPDRIAACNWMISAVVAGLAGILIAPISPLVPYSYTLFVVPALAAAIVGGFRSIGLAVGAGLAIGMLQSEATYLHVQHSWLPDGVANLIPLVLILVVLVLRAKPLPARGEIVRTGLARAPRPERLALTTAIAGAAGVLTIVVTSGTWRAALVTSMIFAVISLSIVVTTGLAGQVSLAQLTLAGAAAFLLSPLTSDWGIPFPLSPLLAALGATVLGVIVGAPALRIRGLPAAIVTLSLAVTVQAMWFQNADLVGAAGKTIAEPTLFGVALGPGSGSEYPRLAFCFLVLSVLILVALAIALLRRSRFGSSMLAVRANERAAAACGVNVVATKILAFASAAFIAGIGGSLYGYRLGTVTWDSFDVLLGLALFATVYVAGITAVSGGVLAGVLAAGGIVAYATTQWLSVDVGWYQIVTGVALIASVIKNPGGIVGAVHRRLDRRGDAVAATAAVHAAPATPPRATPSVHVDEPVLTVRNLSLHYGGVVAVDDVSFDVPRGAIVGLIGPNGAGKTSVIDAVSGFSSYEGSVSIDGSPLDGLRPHRRVSSGLGRTFQGLELWDDLTVGENIVVGPGASARSAADIDALMARLGLAGVHDTPTSDLSQGARQLVSIARALIGGPKVVLLDEPAAGLDTRESRWLADRLEEVRRDGTTVLLVDHDMELVLSLCDRIFVLDFGRLIARGTPAEIRQSTVVAEAYLGTAHVPEGVA